MPAGGNRPALALMTSQERGVAVTDYAALRAPAKALVHEKMLW